MDPNEWNKQMEEMVRNWTDMQRQMWDQWLQSVKSTGFPGASGAEEWQKEYQRQLEAWEKAVRDALEAQLTWTREFTNKAGSSEHAPEAMNEMLRQSQEMMKSWTEAQAKLWDAWFDSVKNMDPSQMAGQWETDGQQVLKAWQEATQRAQDALRELSKAAPTGGGSGGGASGGSGGGSGGGSKGSGKGGGSRKS